MPAQPPVLSLADQMDAVRAQIVDELVDVMTTAFNAQLDGFTTRLAEALQEAGERCADAERKKLHISAATLLRKNRYPFSFVAAERVRIVLHHELQAAADAKASAGTAAGALKSLAPDVEVDKTLSLLKAGRDLEEVHSERLSSVGIRLACLFEREELAPAQHPFRPQLFLTVIHDAWCEFHPDIAAHALVFPLLRNELCVDMAPILHAANMALVKRGILPRLDGRKATGAKTAGHAAGATAATDATQTLDQRLFALLGAPDTPAADHRLDGAFPTLIDQHALRPGGSGQTLLDYLDTLQKNLFDQHLTACPSTGPQSATVLAHIRRHAPAGSILPRDDKVIELLCAIFESVLNEPGIAPELRTMLASLQLPMLKAALTDRAFFFRADQPARRTIELLAELGVGWDRDKGQADPLYQAFKRNVERIQRGADKRTDVFVDAVWDIESFIRREQTAADHKLAAPIAQAVRDEKLRQAEKAARRDIALRIGTGEVVAFIETFLEDKWVAALTLAYSVQEEKPKAVQSAVKTMDDLVWSVKPKITLAERKELLGMLPKMVASLNKWMDLIKWNDDDRMRFFAELAACHASLVRAPLEMSPQRQVELALEVTRKAAERRLEIQAREVAPPEPDAFDRHVATLERGAWLEFAVPSGKRRLKLAWISPMRSLFLFATRDRQQALSLSDEALAAALRDQRAQIVEPGGLVKRVLCKTLGVNPANCSHAQSAA